MTLQRRDFLALALSVLSLCPLLAAGRLDEHTRLGGVNPNDLKIAGRNTG